MLLSAFCRIKRAERAADLGSGCGIIALRWHDRGHRGPCFAVELQPAADALLRRALATPCRTAGEAGAGGTAENGAENTGGGGPPQSAAFLHAEHIIPICKDLRVFADEYSGPPLDAVCCNPPYFAGGPVCPDPARALARHQLACTTQEVCRAAAALLRDGGRFCLCGRPAGLGRAMAELYGAGLVPKRLRLVRQRPGGRPWLFLLDARRAGGEGLVLEDDLLMEAPGGGFSAEVLEIYGKEPPGEKG